MQNWLIICRFLKVNIKYPIFQMWLLIDGVLEALSDNESRQGGLLVVASYKYFVEG